MNDVEDLDLELADPPESAELVETLWQEAALARRYGDLDPAVRAYRRIIELDPGHSEARLAAAECCRLAGRLREALLFCLELLELDPQHVACRLEMAESLRRLGRNDDAHAIVEILLVERPDAVPVWCGLAHLLTEEGRLAGAETVLRRALALDSAHAPSLALLGRVLTLRDDCDEAVDVLHAAVLLEPDKPEHQSALAEALTALGRFDEARDHLERALALDDENAVTRLARSRMHLRDGHLEQAWIDAEWRRRLPGAPRPPHAAAPWEGEPLLGAHLLIHAESDLSDTIDLLRFVPPLRQQAAELTLLAPPPLVPLLAEMGTFGRVVPRDQALPPGLVVDFVAALEDLPGRLDIGLDTLPAEPYLAPAPHRIRRIVAPPPVRLKVGMAWHDEARPGDGMSFEQLLELTDVPGAMPFSLQLGPEAEEARRKADPALITDLSPTCVDYADLAGRIAQLDMVVSTDTPVAHLAAAMGKTVVLMLPRAGNPLWMRDRTDSPWYSGVHLLRRPGRDWRPVIAEARAMMALAVETRAQRDEEERRRVSGRLPAMRAFLGAHLEPGDLLVDVGSGAGRLLLDLAEALSGRFLALALEPSRPNAEFLRDILALCGLEEQVEVIEAAAGAAPGRALASAVPRADGARVFPLPDWVPAAVPIHPLAELIDQRPHLAQCRLVVHVDQPGWEAEIVTGLAGRAAIIALEHRPGAPAADTLRAAGYSLWRFADEAAAGAPTAFDGRPGPLLALAPGLAPAAHYGVVGLPPSSAAVGAAENEASGIAQRGLLLHRLMHVSQAAELYALALTKDPFCAMANANLANLQHMAGKPMAAAASLRRAMAVRPHSAVRSTLAGLMRENSRFAEAEALLLPALEEKPDDPALLHDLGLLRRNENRLDEAAALMRRIIEMDPANHRHRWALAQILLGGGNMAEGLALMGHRPAPKSRAPDLPPWLGQSLAAVPLLLEVPEEDSEAILLARFLQPLAARGALIVVSCRTDLVPLFADLPGVEAVVAEDEPLPPCRMRTTLSALPTVLGADALLRPTAAGGYLTAGRGRRAGRDGRLRVGLTWDLRRSHACPPVALLEPVGNPRLGIMALGEEHELRIIAEQGVDALVERPVPTPRDWAEAAVLLSGLDVVMGGDTPWLHLAAALGKPALAILPDRFDRRFPRDREDNPWYPTMRVFRPGPDGDWRAPVRRAAQMLAVMAERKARM